MTEHDLQIACVEFLDMRLNQLGLFLDYFDKNDKVDKRVYPRTISPILKCSPQAGKKQRLLGYQAGSPDLIIFISNKGFNGLLVEFKVGKNKQQSSQTSFMSMAVKLNYKYALVYRFEEFQELIEWYLGKE